MMYNPNTKQIEYDIGDEVYFIINDATNLLGLKCKIRSINGEFRLSSPSGILTYEIDRFWDGYRSVYGDDLFPDRYSIEHELIRIYLREIKEMAAAIATDESKENIEDFRTSILNMENSSYPRYVLGACERRANKSCFVSLEKGMTLTQIKERLEETETEKFWLDKPEEFFHDMVEAEDWFNISHIPSSRGIES